VLFRAKKVEKAPLLKGRVLSSCGGEEEREKGHLTVRIEIKTSGQRRGEREERNVRLRFERRLRFATEVIGY